MASNELVEPAADAHPAQWVDYHRRRLAEAWAIQTECLARADLAGEAAAKDAASRAIHALEELGIVGLG